jgi:hypothetical protein
VKVFWMITAAACGVAAVIFVFRDDYETAFVAAAFGAVCWFLNYRQQLKGTMPGDEDEEQDQEKEESDEEVHS